MSEKVRKISIPITGMTCAACAGRVEKALSKTEGVSGAGMNFATGKATVEYNPETVGLGELVGIVEDAGYGAEAKETSFDVSGMSCASCVVRVEKALRKIPSILDVNVNLATEKARVRYLSGVTEMRDLERAVQGAGYVVVREEEESVEDAHEREYGKLWVRFVVAAVLTGLILLGRVAVLRGGVGRAQARAGQHEHAGRGRDERGLPVQRDSDTRAGAVCFREGGRVLRHLRAHHHAHFAR